MCYFYDFASEQSLFTLALVPHQPGNRHSKLLTFLALENHDTKRIVNWSKVEVYLLLQLIKERKGIIKGKVSPNLTIQHKRQAWVEVTRNLNAAFPSVCRTKKQVEKKWLNILTKWKRGLAATTGQIYY